MSEPRHTRHHAPGLGLVVRAVDYEEREAELLEANKRYLDRARAAEAKLAADEDLGVHESASGAFDIIRHLERQRAFSLRTFGPGERTRGVVDHIRKEICEARAKPNDISEWADIIILSFDGAWRAGWEPRDLVGAILFAKPFYVATLASWLLNLEDTLTHIESGAFQRRPLWLDAVECAIGAARAVGFDAADLIAAIVAKQTRNESRIWPDWRTADPDKAIEHDRTADHAHG